MPFHVLSDILLCCHLYMFLAPKSLTTSQSLSL